jgi:hypothetical protein
VKRRSSTIALLLLGFGVLLLTACQGETQGPSTSEYEKQRAAILEKQRSRQPGPPRGTQPAEEEASEDVLLGGDGSYRYLSEDKRDPFRSFILDRLTEVDSLLESPLEKFDLSQLDIAGVVWKGDKRRVLVMDPSGQGYVIQEGDRIGKNNGHVLEIRDSSMLVREAYVDFAGEKTMKEIEMRIRQSQGG